MATRSVIAMLRPDGRYEAVYCHWDGYISHNGRILQEHYNTEEKVAELLSYGDLSVLGENIGTKHNFNDRQDGMCTFYGRDRGETNVASKIFDSTRDIVLFVNFGAADYLYLFKDGEWFVKKFYTNSRFTRLKPKVEALTAKV